MPEGPKDLWTQILELLSQLVTPDWNALILLLPFAMLALALLIMAPVVRAWRRAQERNRPRLLARRTRPMPAGVHLPGPSAWPFIAPIGGALVLLALVFPAGGLPVNPILLAAGLAVSAIAVGGWLWDAGREWRRAEWGHERGPQMPGTDEHALPSGAATPMLAPGTGVLELPQGIHLPGPSPWPFFVPIAGGVVLLGLIFSPMLIIGGILMAILAVAGWYRDAGQEYTQVEAGHLPQPATRDPERAFPKSLVKVYGAIAVISVVLTIAPTLLSQLPGNAGGGASPTAPAESPDAEPEIAAESVTSFTKDRLVIPADTPITLTFDNRQSGVPHDVDIRQGDTVVVDNEIVTGPATVEYEVPPITAGEYTFFCSVHPPMTGTLIAQ